MTFNPADLSYYRLITGLLQAEQGGDSSEITLLIGGVCMNIQNEIEKAAYNLWENSGRIQGREVENWVEAERIVMASYRELNNPKEASKKTASYEKMPVELRKTVPGEMKKAAPRKRAAAKKTEQKSESKKEAGKTK